MERRHFLRSAGLATIGGLAVRGYSSPLMRALHQKSVAADRVLVIVQLYGGNDGLNTVIPLDQYGQLAQFRSNVLIPSGQVLPLSGLPATGLHPALGGLQDMWNDGKLSIVQGVGYPNPDLSHFRSTDIWESGSDSNVVLNSGWIGRYLANEYPNYPMGYPNTTMPDPLAIRIGGPVTVGLQSQGMGMAVALNNTDDPLDLTGNIFVDPVTPDCAGSKLDLVRLVQRQTDLYGDVIENAAVLGCNQSTLYPTGSAPGAKLANALKIVAQLICGGLKTRIYWVSMSGFDTHAQQVDSADHAQGEHAELLQGLGDAIHAFQDDLNLLGLEDRVIGMTFSEFGRRVMSNGSGGTDHGWAEPMFLFGTNVIPGMLGTNPVIDPNTDWDTNVAMQYDFRSVYAGVLKDWFCLDQQGVDDVLLNTFQPLALVDPAGCISTDVQAANQVAGLELLQVYPNPFQERTTARFLSNGGHVMLQVFTPQGALVSTVVNRVLPAGEHKADIDLGPLPTGTYYCRLQNGRAQQVRHLIKVR
ncbi:MAG: DUF1501 domain-containing protein [Flavobacteriales bacterium]|nr:DUF1501 domain-containing protein [Flavobacteriales bacterium]